MNSLEIQDVYEVLRLCLWHYSTITMVFMTTPEPRNLPIYELYNIIVYESLHCGHTTKSNSAI